MKNLIVIGITGSFGKTTQKDILYTILSTKFNVLTTEENKNTPLWISKVVLSKLYSNHDIFIVEMWAYTKGDISEICNIVYPKIWIITGIWPQHMERFGDLENILKTKFELIDSLPTDGFAIINQNTNSIEEFLKTHTTTIQKIETIKDDIQIKYLSNFAGIEFSYQWHTFISKLLAKHSAINLILAYETVRYLWVDSKDIMTAIKRVGQVPHRLELIHNTIQNIYIIDDSYNGNIEWVKSTIDMMKHTPFTWRKIYITPWLVELGKDNEKIHAEIGNLLYKIFDYILLIKNKNTEIIRKTLIKNDFPNDHIKIYETATKAHNDIKNIVRGWDVIVFQNDLTDNYL